MTPRKKSKFEKWFSFSRYQRRFGAAQVSSQFEQKTLDELKEKYITGSNIEYTFGANKNLSTHITNLKKEFIDQPEICHFHATLIVLIRREVDIKENFARFKELWLLEKEFLIQHLNIRWLISACDTFIDHDDDLFLKALMMNAVVLINTIKMQETEKLLCDQNFKENASMKHKLMSERVNLFDGISAFAVGTDDTLRNMRWRLEELSKQHELGQIVIEVFKRLNINENSNVYMRFKQRHIRPKTSWW